MTAPAGDRAVVTLRAVACVCDRCGEHYRDAVLVGGYGRLVVRDDRGRCPALGDLLEDPLVDELGAAAAERRALFGRVGAGARPDVQAAWLALCDPSPEGRPWDRDALPACPRCGAAPARCERLEELVRAELPLLRHEALDALPRDERQARLAAALRAATPAAPVSAPAPPPG